MLHDIQQDTWRLQKMFRKGTQDGVETERLRDPGRTRCIPRRALPSAVQTDSSSEGDSGQQPGLDNQRTCGMPAMSDVCMSRARDALFPRIRAFPPFI